MFALPFGETAGVNCVVEFDTETNTFATHNLQGIDFAKKYNAGVLLGKTNIALPYRDEHVNDSNLGLKFDTITGQSDQFKINQSFGGKYRFRCGIKYYDEAYFFPSGTPACPILVINKDGQITNELHERNILFGRPIVFDGYIYVIKVDLTTKSHKLCIYDRNLQIVNEKLI